MIVGLGLFVGQGHSCDPEQGKAGTGSGRMGGWMGGDQMKGRITYRDG